MGEERILSAQIFLALLRNTYYVKFDTTSYRRDCTMFDPHLILLVLVLGSGALFVHIQGSLNAARKEVASNAES